MGPKLGKVEMQALSWQIIEGEIKRVDVHKAYM